MKFIYLSNRFDLQNATCNYNTSFSTSTSNFFDKSHTSFSVLSFDYLTKLRFQTPGVLSSERFFFAANSSAQQEVSISKTRLMKFICTKTATLRLRQHVSERDCEKRRFKTGDQAPTNYHQHRQTTPRPRGGGDFLLQTEDPQPHL